MKHSFDLYLKRFIDFLALLKNFPMGTQLSIGAGMQGGVNCKFLTLLPLPTSLLFFQKYSRGG